MAFLDRLFKRSPVLTEQKQVPVGSTVMYQTVGAGFHKRHGYEDFAKDGYIENAIVYRCVNEIAQGASTIHMRVFDGDTEMEAHPLLALLERPNPLQAGHEYFASLYSYLLLSGNSYALRTGPDGREPQELHLMRPDRMRVVPSKSYIPNGYEYVIAGKVVESYDVNTETGMSEIKHFKMWHPLDDYYGLSPLNSAAADIDQHNLAARHNVNLLNNGARPTGAIVFNPRDFKSGLPATLTEEQRSQIVSDLELRFSGASNAGRAMLLEGDFDWKEMGLSPKDMDFLQLKNMSARDIALCFGVPSQLVGVPDSQTYANVAEARLALYEETIIPLAKRVESDLNEWLSPLYGDRIRIEYDIDSIPAMAERRKRVYENVVAGVREGILSRNEARDRLGLDEIDGGDDVYIAANLFPLGSSGTTTADDQTDGKHWSDAYGETKLDNYPDGKPVDPNLPSAYRLGNAESNCGNCRYLEGNECTLFNAEVRDEYVCAKWESEDEDKAESDIDLTPTEGMAEEAERGLAWRREHGRGGTAVGIRRASQLKNRTSLSPSTVRRMHSFFSRHEVDKRAEGFRQGEDGYPSNGRIAWALWGGDAGQSWARKKRGQLERAKAEEIEILLAMEEVTQEDEHLEAFYDEGKATKISERVKKALSKKVEDHNEQHGDKKGKRVTLRMLSAVFRRGVGAYHTNPQSVRPNVTGPDQWGLARVNAFLRAVRTGKFKSGRFDLDLLPTGHPLKK